MNDLVVATAKKSEVVQIILPSKGNGPDMMNMQMPARGTSLSIGLSIGATP